LDCDSRPLYRYRNKTGVCCIESREGAIGLNDCECIGIKVSSKVTGESVAKDLEYFFEKAGEPIAIIKDGGRVLNSGVEIYNIMLILKQLMILLML